VIISVGFRAWLLQPVIELLNAVKLQVQNQGDTIVKISELLPKLQEELATLEEVKATVGDIKTDTEKLVTDWEALKAQLADANLPDDVQTAVDNFGSGLGEVKDKLSGAHDDIQQVDTEITTPPA
jgi:archaellum component FlaC